MALRASSQALPSGRFLRARAAGPSHLVVLVAAVAAVAVAATLTWSAHGNLFIAASCCTALCATILVYEYVRTRDVFNGTTLLLSAVLLGFGARGLSLVNNPGTLKYPKWVSLDVRDQLATRGLWTATIGAAALYVGYRIGLLLVGSGRSAAERVISRDRVRIAIAVLALAGVGAFAYLLYKLGGVEYFRRLAYAREKTAGLGIPKLISGFARLALFFWLLTTPRLRATTVIPLTVLVLLLTTGQRSAFFAVAIPAMVIYHYRTHRISLRAVAVLSAIFVLVAIAFVQYRHYTRSETLRQREVGGATVTREPPPTGSSSPFSTALVSLDGLVLVQEVVPRDRAPMWGRDLALVFEGFVPRSVWPSKPQWYGDQLSSHYLSFRVSGIFLSGFGYLWAMGLLPGVVIGSLVFGALVGWLYGVMRRSQSKFWLLVYAVSAVTAFRFVLAGDASTLFFYLQALVPAVIVFFLVSSPARRGADAKGAVSRRAIPLRLGRTRV